MANRFPSFPWYPDDWLGSTARATMTREERAAYIDLLCHYWNTGCQGLPSNSGTLRQLSDWPDMPKKSLSRITRQFSRSKGGKLHNAKLQAIYNEKVAFVEGKREAGKQGAAKRWHTHTSAIGTPMLLPMAKDSLPSPSPSPSPFPDKSPLSPPLGGRSIFNPRRPRDGIVYTPRPDEVTE